MRSSCCSFVFFFSSRRRHTRLQGDWSSDVCSSDLEEIGANIVKRALEEPLRQIAQNAGVEGAIVVGRIRESKDEHFGYNAETGEYGDLVKMGVIDPAKVTRLALQNAAAGSALMLTTEALVAEIKGEEKKSAAAAGAPGGDMY